MLTKSGTKTTPLVKEKDVTGWPDVNLKITTTTSVTQTKDLDALMITEESDIVDKTNSSKKMVAMSPKPTPTLIAMTPTTPELLGNPNGMVKPTTPTPNVLRTTLPSKDTLLMLTPDSVVITLSALKIRKLSTSLLVTRPYLALKKVKRSNLQENKIIKIWKVPSGALIPFLSVPPHIKLAIRTAPAKVIAKMVPVNV